MKASLNHPACLCTLSCLAAVLLTLTTCHQASAAIVATFGEGAPTSDIIVAYNDGVNEDGLYWGWQPGARRDIAQSFIVPDDSDYSLEAISMAFATNFSLISDFTSPSGFTISFVELETATQNPATGTPLAVRSGTMQPTLAEAVPGSFFTFHLEEFVLLEKGKAYAYVLSFDEAVGYNYLQTGLAVTRDPNGSSAWMNNDESGWSNPNRTYIYYLQGTAVPEPGSLALLAVAGVGLFAAKRRFRKN